MTLWGGRFSEPTDGDLRKLNDSLPFDRRMAPQDIRGSIAYARALEDAGLLTPVEAESIVDGLYRVKDEIENDLFDFQVGDEDIHTAVERRLTELVGPVGGKLHTGRSRNDQVATDFRMWVMDALVDLRNAVRDLQQALVDQAENHVETLMPGYTHLQPAQPITAGHWLMSYFWMLQRDQDRLADSHARTAVLPLGSGALSGTPFPINRERLADTLGFLSVSENSLDAVSDRDFVAEVLFALSLMGIHLSRFAEDIILFSNPGFGFVQLHDRYSTGSSLMPQKRNADPMELARGKAGRLLGNLVGLLGTLKGLPSGYNKDLQEDKEALFDSVDALGVLIPVLTAVVHTLNFYPERMRAALDDAMLATDLADYLVHRGMPFREAHHIAGAAVRLAEAQGVLLSALSSEALQELSSLFEPDVQAIFDFDAAVARRHTAGGTAPDAVREQIEQARRRLKQPL